MLLNPKHKKALQIMWGVFAVLIVVSMILMSIPSLYS
jgi:hypothetical protein